MRGCTRTLDFMVERRKEPIERVFPAGMPPRVIGIEKNEAEGDAKEEFQLLAGTRGRFEVVEAISTNLNILIRDE